jgi:hypothetical protein
MTQATKRLAPSEGEPRQRNTIDTETSKAAIPCPQAELRFLIAVQISRNQRVQTEIEFETEFDPLFEHPAQGECQQLSLAISELGSSAHADAG